VAAGDTTVGSGPSIGNVAPRRLSQQAGFSGLRLCLVLDAVPHAKLIARAGHLIFVGLRGPGSHDEIPPQETESLVPPFAMARLADGAIKRAPWCIF
jgi:hypothetical protein